MESRNGPHDTGALLEQVRGQHAELFAEHPLAITILLTDFLLPYLRQLYSAFDGDLVKAMVLGEIGQANTRRLVSMQQRDSVPTELADHPIKYSVMRGCNGHSVSMASGIARETVRRKIKELESEGLITAHDDGGWQASILAAERFTPSFNFELSRRLLETAVRIAALDSALGGPFVSEKTKRRSPTAEGGETSV